MPKKKISIAIIELREAVQQFRDGGGEFGFHGRRRRVSEDMESHPCRGREQVT
jgi:hypothetical protein